MFEVIGIIFTLYIVVGLLVLAYLYNRSTIMRRDLAEMFQRGQRFEIVVVLGMSLWCWPWPLIEHLAGD